MSCARSLAGGAAFGPPPRATCVARGFGFASLLRLLFGLGLLAYSNFAEIVLLASLSSLQGVVLPVQVPAEPPETVQPPNE